MRPEQEVKFGVLVAWRGVAVGSFQLAALVNAGLRQMTISKVVFDATDPPPCNKVCLYLSEVKQLHVIRINRCHSMKQPEQKVT